MKNKICAIFIDKERMDLFMKNFSFYFSNLFISKKYPTYLIDLTNIHLIKKKTAYNFSHKKIIYFKPENLSELKNFVKKNKIIGIIKIKQNVLNLRLHIILKLLKIKTMTLTNYGFFPIDKEKRNLIEKLLFFLNIKFNYYIFRILAIFNIVNKFDIFVTSSKRIIDSINNGLSKKFENVLPFLKISFYKKIYRVNTLFYDNYLEKKFDHEPSNEHIVFCDSGFDHRDRALREKNISNEDRENYYKQLNFFLKNLEKNLNKKVLYCKHPKCDYPKSENFNLIEKNFEVTTFNTEEKLYESFLAIFQSSLLINYAILLKKKNYNYTF